MKILQSKIVKSLPKIIVFAIVFYNFVWTYWQNSKGCNGLICPWFQNGEFLYPQFFFLLAAFLLFIPRIWSYSISVLISGYFALPWMWMIINWLWTNNYSLSFWGQLIKSQYFGHPLQVWESQIVIVMIIFTAAICSLRNRNTNTILK